MPIGGKISSNFTNAYEASKPKPPPQPLPLTGPAPAPAPTPPPRRELGPLPELKKTAVERLILDRTGVDRQFEGNRQRQAQVETAATQQSRDALARRAAQLGGGPSGAFMKMEQNVTDESAQRLGQANLEIDAAKDAELRRMGELETQLNVQREEAQAGRDLAEWQAKSQSVLAEYTALSQGDQFDQDMAFKKDQQAALEKQMGVENAEAIRGNIISVMQSAVALGWSPEKLGSVLHNIGYDYESVGIDPKELLGIEGVTTKAPEVTKVAPKKAPVGDQPVGKVERASDGSGMYIDETGTRYVYRNGRFTRAGV